MKTIATNDIEPITECKARRVREFCEEMRISNSTFWKFVALGKIKIIRIGGRVLVPAEEAARIASEGVNQ